MILDNKGIAPWKWQWKGRDRDKHTMDW